MSPGDFLLGLVAGFWWGEWVAERRAAKVREHDNSAFKLLFGMVSEVIEKRKFVGRSMTITRREQFEVRGERFTLSLHSEGDPAEVDETA